MINRDMAAIIRRCTTLLPSVLTSNQNLIAGQYNNTIRSLYRSPGQFSAEYNGLFNETGVMTNKKLTQFFVRHNTSIAPIEDFLDLKVEQKENETYLEAVPVKTGREGLVVEKKSEACALCRLNLTNIQYTDVMILSQFIKRDGSLATYYESKLCRDQYKMICGLIKKAQRCNLIPRPADYLVPGPWHDLNTYLEPDRKRDQPMRVVKKQYWRI